MLQAKVRDRYEQVIVDKFRHLYKINSNVQGNFEELYVDDKDYNSNDGLQNFLKKMKAKYMVPEYKMYEIIYEITGYTREQICPA